ncbi:hypothetical protein KJ991_02270 [Patescibacteria group bacterium]|nr:hypothetical protein [Patescibacteria group bacterium]MBU4057804.1 hypothetical protein [Patescibacteria group bacterium]MBU4115613.1 hypothetical protein [Patescibacteria group bacterium]
MEKATNGQFREFIGKILVNESDEMIASINKEKIQSCINSLSSEDVVMKNLVTFINNDGKVIVDRPKIININRSKPFDPATFISSGWSIEEQDEKSLALTEINITKVMFETTLEKGEKAVNGEEKLKRLKEKNCIRLDAKIFQTLWENQNLIPKEWKEKTNGNTTFIFFDGTILRGSSGFRYVLHLYWGDGKWSWDYCWLVGDFDVGYPSTVLAS